jgi:hypothetical protein
MAFSMWVSTEEKLRMGSGIHFNLFITGDLVIMLKYLGCLHPPAFAAYGAFCLKLNDDVIRKDFLSSEIHHKTSLISLKNGSIMLSKLSVNMKMQAKIRRLLTSMTLLSWKEKN